MAAEPHRTFEDLVLGEKRISSEKLVAEAEILAFPRAHDPQWFHSDPDRKGQSVFGQVIASGIHVLALWRQVDHEVNWHIDRICRIGWDDLRLNRAVRDRRQQLAADADACDPRSELCDGARFFGVLHQSAINVLGRVLISELLPHGPHDMADVLAAHVLKQTT